MRRRPILNRDSFARPPLGRYIHSIDNNLTSGSILGSVATLQSPRGRLAGCSSWRPSVCGLFKWRQFEPEVILMAMGVDPTVVSPAAILQQEHSFLIPW